MPDSALHPAHSISASSSVSRMMSFSSAACVFLAAWMFSTFRKAICASRMQVAACSVAGETAPVPLAALLATAE